jgi:WNK lysine deficient protein kinase
MIEHLEEHLKEHLKLGDKDVDFIAELIDYLILKLLPWWKPSPDQCSSGEISLSGTNLDGQTIMACPWGSVLTNISSEFDDFSGFNTIPAQDFVTTENTCVLKNDDNVTSEIAVENDHASLGRSISELEHGDTYFEECKVHGTNCSVCEGIVFNDIPKNSRSNSETSNVRSLASSCSSVTSIEKDIDLELKFELDIIESHYHHQIEQLIKLKLEALEATKRKWMAKKKVVVH